MVITMQETQTNVCLLKTVENVINSLLYITVHFTILRAIRGVKAAKCTAYKVQNGLLSTTIFRFNYSCAHYIYDLDQTKSKSRLSLSGNREAVHTATVWLKSLQSTDLHLGTLKIIWWLPLLFIWYIFFELSFSRIHIFFLNSSLLTPACAILPNNTAFKYCATWCVPDLW